MSQPDFKKIASAVVNSIGYQRDPETAIHDCLVELYRQFEARIADLTERIAKLEDAPTPAQFKDFGKFVSRLREACAKFDKPAPGLPPVDKSARCLVDGSPETEDYREINPSTGMQKDYVVLTPEERRKGFIRPVRTKYVHNVPGCGAVTSMQLAIAETYARDPKFYDGTYCCECRGHFPVAQFTWYGTQDVVGS